MPRELTDAEETQLEACLEEAGCKDLGALLEFIRDAQSDTTDVEYNDPNLVAMGLPRPDGKLGAVFVHVVNEFVKHAHKTGNYPKLPDQLGETQIAMNVGAVMGVTTSTARKKIRQLAAVGWFASKHKSIQNPVGTYDRAFWGKTPHPGIKAGGP